MYSITSDIADAMTVWERTGWKVYILETEENAWFVDTTFERVKTLEEFFEKVKEDYKIWEGRRENPAQTAEDYAIREDRSAGEIEPGD